MNVCFDSRLFVQLLLMMYLFLIVRRYSHFVGLFIYLLDVNDLHKKEFASS